MPEITKYKWGQGNVAWIKLDDNFPDHRKLAELGDYAPLCGWLFICGLAYCNRQLTDGLIPKVHVSRLASFRHISIQTGEIRGMASFGEDVEPEILAELLVSVGLWEDKGTHYLIHDYLDYQPSKDQVLRERAATAQRVRRHRASKEGNGVGNGVTSLLQQRYYGVSTPSPVPVPVPKKTRTRKRLCA